MSGSGQSPDAAVTVRDHRAVAAISAAIIGAALGVGQLWFGQAAGILAWRGNASSTGTLDEAAIVIWLAASSVSLAAAAPMLLLRVRPSARRRLVQVAMAVFGASLTAPVATAIAAWSQMYGGDLSQLRVTRLVAYGVALGGLMALISVRSQPAAWSLLYWLGIGWLFMWGSVSVAPNISPMLGHLDPGPEWDMSSRYWQARLVLIAIAAVLGAALGAAARVLRWCPGGLTPILLSAVAGPGLMLAAYLATAGIDGHLRLVAITNLAVAGLVAIIGAYLGAALIRHAAPAHPQLG